MFRVVEKKKRSIIVGFEARGDSSHREFIFEDEAAMEEFCATIETNKKLMDSRSKTHLDMALGGIKLKKDEQLTLLFDICSGLNLPKSDVVGHSDPYVIVRFDGKKIHKTGVTLNQENPIWTLRKGALFIWKVDALELFQSEEGLVLEVKDFDTIGSNESLGAFNISAHTLYKWNGERRKYALKPLAGQKDFKTGSIALRVRRATDYDIEFMEKFNEKKKISNISFPEMPNVGTTLKSIMTVHSKKELKGPDKGKTKYLIRPKPDPKRVEETSWLTKEKIEEETMRPSYNWTDIGSGNLGKVFVEVLGCDNLPNLDAAGTLGDKTDAFVSLVYEDCSARTDIIADCLSPRWLPWMRRAFIFNMMHTSSQLFLAVFDSDENSICSHALVGRVSIDISNFQTNSVYELHYKLYRTAQCARKKNFGTIKIRLRLELEDERTLLLSNFKWPQSVYVNTDRQKDYEVIKKTVEGNFDMRRYNPISIYTFIDELLENLTLYYYLEDAFASLIFWRGKSIVSLPVPSYSTRSLKWVDVGFPIHSSVAFICAINLVENPELLPSFCFLCIGWLLLAREEWRIKNPNPWAHCKSFRQLLSALILGKSSMGPLKIQPKENPEGGSNSWDKRLEEAEKKAKARAKKYVREQAQYLKDMEEIGDSNEDLAAREGHGFPTISLAGLPVDPKVYLFPIQQYLRLACVSVRVLKNIIVWEECYLSFWIAMISFILSVVCFLIPWGFFLKWTSRIIAWVAFGPWMILLDKFYINHLTEEEMTDEKKLEYTNKRKKWLDKQKEEAQLAREKASKLRDFKQYMFGQRICRVNILKKDRYYDVPLPTSSASVYNPKSKSLGELAMQEAGYHRKRVNGQQLIGEMIPKIYENPSTEAPTGRPTKKTDLLEKGSPASFYDGNDSYSAAAIKVGSIIVGAGAITWFGVPLFVYLVRLLLPE